MSDIVDHSTAVRDGEEIDAAKLAAYLKDHAPDLTGDLSIEQFPGGHSNLTYHLRVGGRDLVLRRPPFGSKVKSAHDMKREFTVLSALHPVYPTAPKALVFCDDPDVMGADFYVMERIRGVVLRLRQFFQKTPHSGNPLLEFQSSLNRPHLSPPERHMLRLCRQFFRQLNLGPAALLAPVVDRAIDGYPLNPGQ